MSARKKPSVLVCRRLPDDVQARLKRDYDPRFNETDRVYSGDELVKLSEGADAILACHSEIFSADVIARLPKSVRAVANFSVGYDHVDVKAAKARGLIVTNTPDVLNDATAEIAMLLLLGAARRAAEGERIMRNNEWKEWSPAFMVGTQVTGKRVGVVGMGRVGQILARRARGFDMEVHYYNRHRLSPDLEHGATYHPTLESLLPVSQFLSIHCPATPETRGMMNAARFALLPRGAIVVNTGRGAVVDDEALIAALKSGHLGAAGLDVFNNEPNVHPGYRQLWNTFLLPHIGSATRETRNAMGFRALDNLDAVFAGQEPRDRVA
ncbi:MAG: D-glycerate dehydrogenase [Alphaproteobacteria bacterium]|nr:D-glycerate dehydrogenase [Alphaproteobacteria bacterium]